jgi:hypothetical protein
MEKLFSQLPITIQQAKKSKVLIKTEEEPLFSVKKYNSKRHIRVSFYKPISKMITI